MKHCLLNKREKFGAKIFLHFTNIVIFMLGYFILTHPVNHFEDVSHNATKNQTN